MSEQNSRWTVHQGRRFGVSAIAGDNAPFNVIAAAGYCAPLHHTDDDDDLNLADAHWSPAVADAELAAWQTILDRAKQ